MSDRIDEETVKSASKMFEDMSLCELGPENNAEPSNKAAVRNIDDMSIGEIVRDLEARAPEGSGVENRTDSSQLNQQENGTNMFQTSKSSQDDLKFLMSMIGALHDDAQTDGGQLGSRLPQEQNTLPRNTQISVQNSQTEQYFPGLENMSQLSDISEVSSASGFVSVSHRDSASIPVLPTTSTLRTSAVGECAMSGPEVEKLFDAIENNFYEYIEHQLSSNMVSANATNVQGSRPLIIAAKIPILRIMRLLINYGADVNQTDNNGWTAMHWAARRSNREAVKLLLDVGGNMDLITREGKSVKDVALEAVSSNRGDVLISESGMLNVNGLSGSTNYSGGNQAKSHRLPSIPSFKLDCNSKIFTDPNYQPDDLQSGTRQSLGSHQSLGHEYQGNFDTRDNFVNSPGSTRASLSGLGDGSATPVDELNNFLFAQQQAGGGFSPNTANSHTLTQANSMPMGSNFNGSGGSLNAMLGQTGGIASPNQYHGSQPGLDELSFNDFQANSQRRMTAPQANNNYTNMGGDVFQPPSFPSMRRTTLDSSMTVPQQHRQQVYTLNSYPSINSAGHSPSVSPHTSPHTQRSPKMTNRTSLSGAHATLGIPYPVSPGNQRNTSSQSYGQNALYTHGSSASPAFSSGAQGSNMYNSNNNVGSGVLFSHNQAHGHMYGNVGWNPVQSAMNSGGAGGHMPPSTPDRLCIECGTSKTPQWRRSEDGSVSLCNACGLKLKHKLKKQQKLKESNAAKENEGKEKAQDNNTSKKNT
ncbi:hypothetical protein SARC_05928 [Sphaeroforma arctica JP610]|uniref:GATA-type domain-containing protein n=1 Tax=Sphaeroforma arctica JP610 TaxID=667725 RepID=A0A0L0FY76_9EUKA|nr:hypothetical protein SARC_05928 [Sphaeroforma arctica JP610]KNC81782.1 hypothetical protein SARC_05928 [Sphaeroforma arctica JP610]|eukprot:XP_014155684.1 hypothetical protein SARC_05928 [Sphaeroforma arctica JP610]